MASPAPIKLSIAERADLKKLRKAGHNGTIPSITDGAYQLVMKHGIAITTLNRLHQATKLNPGLESESNIETGKKIADFDFDIDPQSLSAPKTRPLPAPCVCGLEPATICRQCHETELNSAAINAVSKFKGQLEATFRADSADLLTAPQVENVLATISRVFQEQPSQVTPELKKGRSPVVFNLKNIKTENNTSSSTTQTPTKSTAPPSKMSPTDTEKPSEILDKDAVDTMLGDSGKEDLHAEFIGEATAWLDSAAIIAAGPAVSSTLGGSAPRSRDHGLRHTTQMETNGRKTGGPDTHEAGHGRALRSEETEADEVVAHASISRKRRLENSDAGEPLRQNENAKRTLSSVAGRTRGKEGDRARGK